MLTSLRYCAVQLGEAGMTVFCISAARSALLQHQHLPLVGFFTCKQLS